MAKRGILKGPKINRRHSTCTNAAERVILAAKSLPSVKKIVLGKIAPLRTTEPRLKFSPIPGGLKAQVRGATDQQDLFIYTSDAPGTERKLQEAWQLR